VIHYTELLSQLTDKGIIPAVKSHNDDVTYHDPCYLGRANHIYDAPRHVIENMGCEIKEMSPQQKFCTLLWCRWSSIF
jgi:Fe-S oxidoreductase